MEMLVPHIRHPTPGGPLPRPLAAMGTPMPWERSCALLRATGRTTQGWPTKQCSIFHDRSLPRMGIREFGRETAQHRAPSLGFTTACAALQLLGQHGDSRPAPGTRRVEKGAFSPATACHARVTSLQAARAGVVWQTCGLTRTVGRGPQLRELTPSCCSTGIGWATNC